jgi:hypothetical protein
MSAFYKEYKPHRFNTPTRAIVDKANEFIAEYEKLGYVLTLRQLYYRFIAKDAFPEQWIDRVYNAREGLAPDTKNTLKNYKRLGDIVNHGREAGLISWTAFEDRNRTLYGTTPVEDPADVVKDIEQRLILDCWADQPAYVEVFVEKDALGPIVARPANRWRAPHMACKGYLSASQAWRAGLRFAAAMDEGKRGVLIHVGDHDPSGKDMTRDNWERLDMFAEQHIEVNRVALNMDQILARNPPPNPAKVTDSRFSKYVEEFGDDCWELDALEPQELDDIVSVAVESYVDKDNWDRTLARERRERTKIKKFYDGVAKHRLPIEALIARLDKRPARRTR